MVYENYDDEQLIELMRESSEEAKDILFDKYRYIISHTSMIVNIFSVSFEKVTAGIN